ncbi:MAG: hypothetical protein ACPG8W_01175 [Candidatus Promineifilaceae bacterium]
MKLRGWITLGLVLCYGIARSEVVAHAKGTFFAQLAPNQLWEQWRTMLTTSSLSDEMMLMVASGAFLLGLLGVWWRPILRALGRQVHRPMQESC